MSLREQTLPSIGSALAGLSIVAFMGILHEKRPNVVFIVVDTLRADAVSTRPGNDQTPAIAELAAEGVEFSNAFSHAPMTLPAHASMFSGRHPHETGVYNNGELVPAEVPLLAETLTQNGYQSVAAVSLATLWPRGDRLGLDRGFETFDTGTMEVAPAEETSSRIGQLLDTLDPDRPFFLFAHLADPHEPYNEHGPWFEGERAQSTAHFKLDGAQLEEIPTSTSNWWRAEVELSPGKHQLKIHSEAPFKLRSFEARDGTELLDMNLTEGAFFEPTSLVTLDLMNSASEPRVINFRAWLNDTPKTSQIRARYASEVQAADAAVGQLINELRRRDLWEDTLVVFTSDHGEALGEHGTTGHVVSLYDELLQVPLIIKLPEGHGEAALKKHSSDLARHIDLTPTVLEFLDLPGLGGSSGESLFRSTNRVLIAETHPPEAPRTLVAMRDDSYKLVFDPDEDRFEMYQVNPDPLELDNVFSQHGQLRRAWIPALRQLASGLDPTGERDEDLQRRLSALGY